MMDALIQLEKQLECVKNARNGHLAALKHSFEFELHETPKLKNVLFQALSKVKNDKNSQESSNS